MRLLFALFVGVFALCSATVIDVGIVQIGKELVYDYETIVGIGTKLNDRFSSNFRLKCKLHVQGLKDDLLGVYLTDCLYNLNHGIVKVMDVTQQTFLPIPTESELLKLPFHVRLDSTGKVVSVLCNHGDKEWSINIKKSIASLLQIDRRLLTNIEKKVGYLGVTTEETVYGLCEVKYNILPRNDIILVKTQDPAKCRNNHKVLRYDDLVGSDSHRRYVLTRKDGHIHVKELNAIGDIILTLQHGYGVVNVLRSKQHLTLVDEIGITKEVTINDQVTLDTLQTVVLDKKCVDIPVNEVLDMSGGRRVLNKDLLVKEVHTILDELVTFIDQHHLTLTKPDIHNVVLIKRILRLLEHFDLATLEHCYVVLEEKTGVKDQRKLNVLLQLLPHVGTKSAVLLIRNLIRKNKIEEQLAIRIVTNIAGSVYCPTEKLLLELDDEELLSIPEGGDEKGKNLKRAYVLTFASLVREVYKNDEKSPALEKYITRVVQKFKMANDKRTKLFCLEVLANIGIGSVLKHLEPIINGEIPVDKSVRVLALWCIKSRVVKDPMLMMKFIWPVLCNRQMDTEMRLVAYYIYVSTVKPTTNRFMNLYWLMVMEPDQLLYTYHYNTLVTLSKLRCLAVFTDDCTIAKIARTVLRLTRVPYVRNNLDGIWIRDLINFGDHGFYIRAKNMFMRTNDATTWKLKLLTRTVDHTDIEFMSIHLRVLTKDKDIVSSNVFENLLSGLQATASSKKCSYEMVIRSNGRTIMVDAKDDVPLSDIYAVLTKLDIFKNDSVRRQYLDIPIHYNAAVPNDLGIPVRVFTMMPVIQSMKINLVTKPNIQFDLKMKLLNINIGGMEYYNPIVDLWHGIQEIKTMAVALPVNMAMTVNPDTMSLKVILKKVGTEDVIGIQQHVVTKVYLVGNNNKEILAKFNKDVNVFETVTRGMDYTRDLTIMETKLLDIGKKLEVKVYDCDRDISRETIIRKLNEIWREQLHDTTVHSVILLNLLRFKDFLMLTNNAGSCGLGIRLTPLDNFDHIEIETTGKTNQLDDNKLFLPALDVNWWLKYVVKTTDSKELVSYDSNLTIKFEELHRNFVWKWMILHKHLGVDKFKMDLDLMGKMNVEDADAKVKLLIGDINKLTNFDIVVKAIRSDEQNRIFSEKKVMCDECRHDLLSPTTLNPVTYECIRILTSLRRLTFDITADKLSQDVIIKLLDIVRYLKMKKVEYIDVTDMDKNKVRPEFKVDDVNKIHLDVMFPMMRRDEINMKVATSQWIEFYTGETQVNRDWLVNFVMRPMNLFYNDWDVRNMFVRKRANVCVVMKDGYLNSHQIAVPSDMPTDWVVYLRGMVDGKEVYIVEVKYLKESGLKKLMAIRVKVKNDVMEVVPITEQECKVTLNGNVINIVPGQYHVESIYQMLMTPYPKTLVLRSNWYGLHLIFDGHSLRMYTPLDLVDKLEGKCFETMTMIQV